MTTSSRYTSVRGGGRALARLAPVVQLGVASLGLAYFLEQAQGLLSDTQFTWTERRMLGLIALSTIVGFALGGWVLGRLLKVVAELLDVLADGAEASWRTVDLLEMHVIPTLGRIAARLDSPDAPQPPGAAVVRSLAPAPSPPRSRSRSPADELADELEAAREAGDVGRALDLRDALTEHLRGEPLHALDQELALWVAKRVERRVREQSADWEVAGWVARALDSLGDMPETESLRAALPVIRRRAGLCTVCGQAVAGGQPVCGRCRDDGTKPTPSPPSPAPRRSSSKERP
ncbi:MAG: hypothetical protein P4L85_09085 [Paludisphaera borealis]|uniref:hypothetical protein n=1 Tax=Paludisphaera borealis TaxID=1387353 RepID=UPI00284A92FC|nr:hypothetical protein [Paludisphaera borealis]MDR3619491.1 hypothetical protein [Paludisphaera borealis]